MKNSFTCPHCLHKQPIKKLFFMSNLSEWRCQSCNTLLKPKKLTNKALIFGFLSVIIPAYFCIFYLEYTLMPSLLVGLIFGIIAYIISLIYFYYNTEFEEIA